MRDRCERHVNNVVRLTDELIDESNGEMAVNPALFYIDSAWTAYSMLEACCQFDLAEVRPWFQKIANSLTSRGFRPLREPWRLS